MAEWLEDEKDYKFRASGHFEETKVHVSGVMDISETERPKLVLSDHPENKGPSLFNTEERTMDECITKLSAAMKIEPHEADWYAVDRNGKLHEVSLSSEREKMENPQFTALKNSGDLNHIEINDAKKAFPDVEVDKLHSSLSEAKADKYQELDKAFEEAAKNKEVEQSTSQEQGNKSAHEYDLSQERMR